MIRIHQAVLKTLAYADIFDYPLTRSELHHWLIWSSQTPPPSINPILKSIPHLNGYYHLPRRQNIIKLRRRRHRASLPKFKLARRLTRYLKIIPAIRLIAVTGALAMNNSDQNDDIDLLIITRANRLWSTRLLAVFILELLGRRRRRPNSDPDRNRDKICLNLFLDEASLKLPPSRRNLYIAHELTQLKPLFDRGHTYQKLLSQNLWLKKYLPNFPGLKNLQPVSSSPPTPLPFIEPFLFKLQYAYMQRKITHEKISLHYAFFHPRQTGKIILKKYQQKLRQLNEKN